MTFFDYIFEQNVTYSTVHSINFTPFLTKYKGS